jgi:hypothetical protein
MVAKPPRASKRRRVTSIRGAAADGAITRLEHVAEPTPFVHREMLGMIALLGGVVYKVREVWFTRQRHLSGNAECRAPRLLARTACTEPGTNLLTPNCDSHQTLCLEFSSRIIDYDLSTGEVSAQTMQWVQEYVLPNASMEEDFISLRISCLGESQTHFQYSCHRVCCQLRLF